jgi:hypothetical protein
MVLEAEKLIIKVLESSESLIVAPYHILKIRTLILRKSKLFGKVKQLVDNRIHAKALI